VEGRNVQDVFDYIDANRERYVETLRRLVNQPSVTTDVEDCIRCADVLAEIMAEHGCPPQVIPAKPGVAPVLFYETGAAANDAPSMIGYAHYDVKMADPLDEWTVDPWGGEIKDGHMYGRGVSDNKSGCLAFLFAVEAMRAVRGATPCNVRLLIEGEEETGSAHLETWALNNRHLIEDSDGLHCLDGHVEVSTGRPNHVLNGRAMLYLELWVRGPEFDVHSSRSHLVENPAWRLVDALRSIKDPKTDRMLVDGWYDDMAPYTEQDEAYVRFMAEGLDEDAVQEHYGTTGRPFPGDRRGLDLVRAVHLEPTCSICGIHSGFTDPGRLMTIVPRVAWAKLDIRCRPFLQPLRLVELLRRHLDEHGFEDIELKVLNADTHGPWKTPFESAMSQACIRASDLVFGNPPTGIGPSGPENVIYGNFGIPNVLTGFSNPDCHIHAPDERLSIDYYMKGIKYGAAIMQAFAEEMEKERSSAS